MLLSVGAAFLLFNPDGIDSYVSSVRASAGGLEADLNTQNRQISVILFGCKWAELM